jgi:hypothetical protein
MGFAKRKEEFTVQEHIEALRRLHMSPVDLRDLIQLVQDFVAEDLERRIAVFKASRRDLPIETIRRELTKTGCACSYGLRLNSD